MLKDKYAKFTPLVFLTNFVFAYQKFQRRLEEEQVQQRQEDYSALIDDVTAVVQMKFSPKEESSQQLVKLIKSETQTRLLEQRCEILEHIKLRHVRRNLYIAYIFLVLVDTTSLPYDHLNLFVPSTFSVVFSSRTTCSVV